MVGIRRTFTIHLHLVKYAEPSNHTEEWVDGMPVSLLKMLAVNS